MQVMVSRWVYSACQRRTVESLAHTVPNPVIVSLIIGHYGDGRERPCKPACRRAGKTIGITPAVFVLFCRRLEGFVMYVSAEYM